MANSDDHMDALIMGADQKMSSNFERVGPPIGSTETGNLAEFFATTGPEDIFPTERVVKTKRSVISLGFLRKRRPTFKTAKSQTLAPHVDTKRTLSGRQYREIKVQETVTEPVPVDGRSNIGSTEPSLFTLLPPLEQRRSRKHTDDLNARRLKMRPSQVPSEAAHEIPLVEAHHGRSSGTSSRTHNTQKRTSGSTMGSSKWSDTLESVQIFHRNESKHIANSSQDGIDRQALTSKPESTPSLDTVQRHTQPQQFDDDPIIALAERSRKASVVSQTSQMSVDSNGSIARSLMLLRARPEKGIEDLNRGLGSDQTQRPQMTSGQESSLIGSGEKSHRPSGSAPFAVAGRPSQSVTGRLRQANATQSQDLGHESSRVLPSQTERGLPSRRSSISSTSFSDVLAYGDDGDVVPANAPILLYREAADSSNHAVVDSDSRRVTDHSHTDKSMSDRLRALELRNRCLEDALAALLEERQHR